MSETPAGVRLRVGWPMTPRLVGHRARAWYDWFWCDHHAVAVKVALLVGIFLLASTQ